MTQRDLSVETQSWPLQNEFRIARGSKTQAEIIFLSITDGEHCGYAEAVPYARYDETPASVTAQIESVRKHIEAGINLPQLNEIIAAGAARNALDCALWDLNAQKNQTSVAELAQVKTFNGCLTAQTLSIDSPSKMAEAALELKHYPLLKIKLDRQLVIERMQAVYKAAPQSQFIIDANESWSISDLNAWAPLLQAFNVVLIEQPLAVKSDFDLMAYNGSIPLCADESFHTLDDLPAVAKLYQFVNIKLDKSGGLSEALKILHESQKRSLGIMVGCMVGTSLAMAPASLLASYADFVDLDGAALLAKDRRYGFNYHNGQMSALNPRLWGN